MRRDIVRRTLRRLGRRSEGAAAVEFGLLLPLLVIMLLGVAEIGRLLFHYHTVAQSVEDGARYLTRAPGAIDCPDGATWLATADGNGDTPVDRARRLTMRGSLDTGQPWLLYYWTAAGSVTVDIDCVANPQDGGTGLYRYRSASNAEVKIVRLSVAVPYDPLFPLFGVSNVTLSAWSEGRHIGE